MSETSDVIFDSVWRDTIDAPVYSKIKKNIHVDVAIIGGGLAGLNSAYQLKQKGKKVAVIEADTIGAGVSGHTTAHITSEHNVIYDYLIQTFGTEKAQIYADANQQAILEIERVIQKEKIECDFIRLSQYLFAGKPQDLETLKKEFEAAKSLHLPVKYLESNDLPFKIFGTIEYADQAQYHPGKYMIGIAKAIAGDGSYIFENSRVLDVKEAEPCTVITEDGEITADDVIVATNFPILDRGGFFARLQAMRSYVFGVYVKENISAMYDDMMDPYHYIRTQKTDKGTLVIIGGEDHNTGEVTDTNACYDKLAEYIKSHFTVTLFAYRWSSQDTYTPDKVPFIGPYTPLSKHLYVATGFNGEGMTQSMISALLLTDLITKQKNDWLELYSPQRFKFTKEILGLMETGVGVMKDTVDSVATKILPSDSPKEVEKIKPGEGTVLTLDKEKIGVYKDLKGNVHAVSAICKHMGCTLSFNNSEKSWDCPCHGSRFGIDGKILHGPTVKRITTYTFRK